MKTILIISILLRLMPAFAQTDIWMVENQYALQAMDSIKSYGISYVNYSKGKLRIDKKVHFQTVDNQHRAISYFLKTVESDSMRFEKYNKEYQLTRYKQDSIKIFSKQIERDPQKDVIIYYYNEQGILYKITSRSNRYLATSNPGNEDLFYYYKQTGTIHRNSDGSISELLLDMEDKESNHQFSKYVFYYHKGLLSHYANYDQNTETGKYVLDLLFFMRYTNKTAESAKTDIKYYKKLAQAIPLLIN